MCGIVGQVGTLSNADHRLQALNQVYHRGPDDQDEWVNPSVPVWIAQRRLSINDLTVAGRQPMVNEDQTIHMICNGEIYNYPMLRRELEQHGHVFYSHSDSEAIIHAYEQWGVAAVEHLIGMFAFALWDDNEQRLLLARDRMGIKPMLFSQVGQGGLIFSSETGGILPLLPQKPSVNPLALSYIMTLGYVPSPLTMWHGIEQLDPGHLMTWRASDGISIRKYWEPPCHIDDNATFDLDEWTALFETVVDEHLLSDVPLGLLLSGGLDSSSVALALNHLKRTDMTTFTVDFVGHDDSENPLAKYVSETLGFTHSIVPFETDDIVLDLAKAVTNIYDMPHGGSAQTTMLKISEHVTQTHKVVLSGDGGDEVFGGYTRYDDLTPSTYTDERSTLRKIWHALKGIDSRSLIPFTERSTLHRHLWRTFPRYLPDEVQTLLAPTAVRFSEDEMLAPFEKHYLDSLPTRRALQRVDLMTYCIDHILYKVDRGSMAHSLEVRVPLLDHRVVEWGLVRPIDQREATDLKPMLRAYLANSPLSERVLNHPKQGFSIRGLETFDWGHAQTIVQNGSLIENGILRPDFMRYLPKQHPYHKARLWVLLMLTLWGDKWL